jgi:hypothetical protein
MGRCTYYSSNYSPHLIIDGHVDAGSSYSGWASAISSELAVSAPMDIQIGGYYNPTSRTGNALIRIIETSAISYTSLKVRIGIIESNITRSAPNGTTLHNQVFRDMTPNITGIPLTISLGDTIYISQAFTCPSPLVSANCELVAFVQTDQSGGSHRIFQGAKRNVMTMTYYMDPFTLISPPNGNTVSVCSPQLIWHHSIDSDSGYAVRYKALISVNSSFNPIFVTSDTLSDTTWTPGLCMPNGLYYWKVIAINGHAPDMPCTANFHFTIFEQSRLTAFNLVSPTNGDTVGICSPSLKWRRSTDPDSGYQVHYQVAISQSQAFETPFIVSDTLSDTTWTPPLCLPDGPFYWKVEAFAPHTINRACDSNFSFVVHERSRLTPFVLISPLSGDTVNICSPPLFWQRSADPDSGYAVHYQVYISQSPSFETPFVISDTLGDTTWTPPLCLPPGPFYWRVEAFAPHTIDLLSQMVFNFVVYEPPTGCAYVVGDANGSSSFTGLDVTYGVRYFKGGPAPTYSCECPPGSGQSWYVSGDVNGSCSFSGLDVTYMVRFFKGGPGPIPCPNCPPVHR